MSFLKIGDRAAGAIKSGGTTRRAAKMVIVDADHPDIEDFVSWKVLEEQKVAALVAGSKACQKHLTAIMKACVNCEGEGERLLRPHEKRSVEARNQGRPRLPSCRTTTSSASFSSRGRASRPFLSQASTPIGRVRPTARSPARTRTIPSASTTRSCSARRRRRRLGAEGRMGGKALKTIKARVAHGERSPRPLGRAPIRAFSSTPPSTTGTPAPRADRCGPRTPARNTCSSTILLAIWPRSTSWRFRDREDGGILDVGGVRPCLPSLDHRSRNLGDNGAVPVEGNRAAILRIPHAGPWLRENLGGLLMVSGLGYNSVKGRALTSRDFRADDRRLLRHLGGNGEGAWRLWGLWPERNSYAARHEKPPARRLWPGTTAMSCFPPRRFRLRTTFARRRTSSPSLAKPGMRLSSSVRPMASATRRSR